jgi:DNA-binding MarR family transcriptional regulator
MENLYNVKNIINLCSSLQNLCEGFDEDSKSILISTKFKVLLAISEKGTLSPSELIYKLGLAKSNIALLAKSMIKEGLISSKKDELDSRIVLYSLTQKGEDELKTALTIMSKNFTNQLAYKNKFKEIDRLVNELKEIID